MYALKLLMQSLGSENIDARQDGSVLDTANGRASYIFNPAIDGIELADAILIIGSNPRFEASLLNARIRKHWRAAGTPIALIGEQADLRYKYEYLGSGAETLVDLANGSLKFLSVLKKAQNPMVIIGQGALSRADGASVLGLAAKIAADTGALSAEWNGFGVVHTAAGRVGALDIGFVPGTNGKTVAEMKGALDVLFLLGADELNWEKRSKAFTVYIGTHGDQGAHNADVILPGAAYTEKSGTYVNTEGRVQMTNRAGFAPGNAKEDWAILRALSDVLGKKLPFDLLAALRSVLYAEYPHLAMIDHIEAGDPADVKKLANASGSVEKTAFVSPVKDFYLTNPIARASAVMAECSALAKSGFKQAAE